jgi:hypothetical protein
MARPIVVSQAAIARAIAARRVQTMRPIHIRPPVLTPYYIGEMPAKVVDALGVQTQWRKVCWGKQSFEHAWRKHFPRNSAAAERRLQSLLADVTAAVVEPTWVHPTRLRIARVVGPDAQILVVCLKYKRKETREEWWITTAWLGSPSPPNESKGWRAV